MAKGYKRKGRPAPTRIDAGALLHFEALGLPDARQYRAWCGEHGFSDGLNKGAQQRKRELRAAEKIKADAALHDARRLTRKPGRTISSIYRGDIGTAELPPGVFGRVHDAFAATQGRPDARNALHLLLLRADECSDLVDDASVVPQFRAEPGNTYVDAMLALAFRCDEWIREPRDWRPRTHNPRRQFGSLARHLLSLYDVPAFMDTAWFGGDTSVARTQQRWFLDVGAGTNIRKVDDMPIQLTKRMAHLLMQASPRSTIPEALRRTQVIGMGGAEALADAVLATRLGSSFENEDFWVSVVKFLVYNPMLDPDYAAPVVEYIFAQKYQPQATVDRDGALTDGDPLHPGFSMRTRRAEVLLAEVDTWRGEQAREQRFGDGEWEPSGFRGLELAQEVGGEPVVWRVRELLSSKALNAEGRAMRHCVGTYAKSCRAGAQSVWSLEVENAGERLSAMTIAVKNKPRAITQARGRANAHPLESVGVGSRQVWLRRCHRVMKQWAERQGITVGRHI